MIDDDILISYVLEDNISDNHLFDDMLMYVIMYVVLKIFVVNCRYIYKSVYMNMKKLIFKVLDIPNITKQ